MRGSQEGDGRVVRHTANHKLNIAAICPSAEALGPGRRFVIWGHGCCLDCHNCSSPEWREMRDAVLLAVDDLSQRILRTRGIEGITISGGEPVLQAAGLHDPVRTVRRRPLTVSLTTVSTLLLGLGDALTSSVGQLLAVKRWVVGRLPPIQRGRLSGREKMPTATTVKALLWG